MRTGGPGCSGSPSPLSPQAQTSGKFSREELDKLWRELQHHREKVREYNVLLEALSRTEGAARPHPHLPLFLGGVAPCGVPTRQGAFGRGGGYESQTGRCFRNWHRLLLPRTPRSGRATTGGTIVWSRGPPQSRAPTLRKLAGTREGRVGSAAQPRDLGALRPWRGPGGSEGSGGRPS